MITDADATVTAVALVVILIFQVGTVWALSHLIITLRKVHGCLHNTHDALNQQNLHTSKLLSSVAGLCEITARNVAPVEELDFDKECVICKSQPISHIMLPCAHFCLCEFCISRKEEFHGKCPMCSTEIMEIKKVYC